MTPDRNPPPARSSPPPECALLVEDDDLVRDLYASMLRRLGHEVLAAADAASALRLFTERDDIGWVMLDVLLPDRSGHELLAELRRQRPDLPALVVSGRAQVLRGEGASRTVFLPKPFEMDQLRRAVSRTRGREDAAGG